MKNKEIKRNNLIYSLYEKSEDRRGWIGIIITAYTSFDQWSLLLFINKINLWDSIHCIELLLFDIELLSKGTNLCM